MAMTRRRKMLYIAPLAILGMVLFIFLGGTIVRLLWNALLPPLFGAPSVTFWQALGLLVLARILFGGFRLGGGNHRRPWRRDRWDPMSPEERDRLKEGMRARWDVHGTEANV